MPSNLLKEKQKKYNKKYRETHRKEKREDDRSYYEAHKDERKARQRTLNQKRDRGIGKEQRAMENRNWSQRRKRLVLTHYGNGKLACARCGFEDIRALSLDHINGGGNQARKNWKGTPLFTYLVKNDYPEGYQTLCLNCNWIKHLELIEFRKMIDKGHLLEEGSQDVTD